MSVKNQSSFTCLLKRDSQTPKSREMIPYITLKKHNQRPTKIPLLFFSRPMKEIVKKIKIPSHSKIRHIKNVYLWILSYDSYYTVQIQPPNYVFSCHYQLIFFYSSTCLLRKIKTHGIEDIYLYWFLILYFTNHNLLIVLFFLPFKLWLLWKKKSQCF